MHHKCKKLSINWRLPWPRLTPERVVHAVHRLLVVRCVCKSFCITTCVRLVDCCLVAFITVSPAQVDRWLHVITTLFCCSFICWPFRCPTNWLLSYASWSFWLLCHSLDRVFFVSELSSVCRLRAAWWSSFIHIQTTMQVQVWMLIVVQCSSQTERTNRYSSNRFQVIIDHK